MINRRPLYFIGITLFVFFLLFAIAESVDLFFVNDSPSVAVGVYRRSFRKPQKNDYVIFSGEVFNTAGLPAQIIKKIKGMPGDIIVIDKKGVSVAGEYFPFYDKVKIRHLTPGTIPEGMVFVAGEHEKSLDSRYFGLVPYEKMKRLRRKDRE